MSDNRIIDLVRNTIANKFPARVVTEVDKYTLASIETDESAIKHNTKAVFNNETSPGLVFHYNRINIDKFIKNAARIDTNAFGEKQYVVASDKTTVDNELLADLGLVVEEEDFDFVTPYSAITQFPKFVNAKLEDEKLIYLDGEVELFGKFHNGFSVITEMKNGNKLDVNFIKAMPAGSIINISILNHYDGFKAASKSNLINVRKEFDSTTVYCHSDVLSFDKDQDLEISFEWKAEGFEYKFKSDVENTITTNRQHDAANMVIELKVVLPVLFNINDIKVPYALSETVASATSNLVSKRQELEQEVIKITKKNTNIYIVHFDSSKPFSLEQDFINMADTDDLRNKSVIAYNVVDKKHIDAAISNYFLNNRSKWFKFKYTKSNKNVGIFVNNNYRLVHLHDYERHHVGVDFANKKLVASINHEYPFDSDEWMVNPNSKTLTVDINEAIAEPVLIVIEELKAIDDNHQSSIIDVLESKEALKEYAVDTTLFGKVISVKARDNQMFMGATKYPVIIEPISHYNVTVEGNTPTPVEDETLTNFAYQIPLEFNKKLVIDNFFNLAKDVSAAINIFNRPLTSDIIDDTHYFNGLSANVNNRVIPSRVGSDIFNRSSLITKVDEESTLEKHQLVVEYKHNNATGRREVRVSYLNADGIEENYILYPDGFINKLWIKVSNSLSGEYVKPFADQTFTVEDL